MKPGYYRHEFKQFEDYSIVLDLQQQDGSPFDNTGYTALSQIRTLDDTLTATFTITFPATNQIKIALSAATTGEMAAKRYLYDLKLVSPDTSQADFWLEGDVIVYKTVSRV